jgi:hypothetical protein
MKGRASIRVGRGQSLPRVLLCAALFALALGLAWSLAGGMRVQTRPDADEPSYTVPSPAPVYVQRGDEVEARYRAYRERLQGFHKTLQARLRSDAPDLLPKVEAAAPKTVRHGYQTLPRVVEDTPAPLQRPRAKSVWYSWPWTARLIERDLQKLDELEAEFSRSAALASEAQRSAYEKVLTAFCCAAGSWGRGCRTTP